MLNSRSPVQLFIQVHFPGFFRLFQNKEIKEMGFMLLDINTMVIWLDIVNSTPKAHPLKVFEDNFIFKLLVWSNFELWSTFTPKAIPDRIQ